MGMRWVGFIPANQNAAMMTDHLLDFTKGSWRPNILNRFNVTLSWNSTFSSIANEETCMKETSYTCSNHELHVADQTNIIIHQIFPLARVLARPKRQGTAPCRFFRRPVVFPQRPVVFSVPCHFPRALWFLRAFISVILSLQLQRASNWGESWRDFRASHCYSHRNIAAILDLRHRFRHEREATLIWSNAIYAIVYLENGVGIYEH